MTTVAIDFMESRGVLWGGRKGRMPEPVPSDVQRGRKAAAVSQLRRKGLAQDGGLRQLFQTRLPLVHWQSVETWSTGRGVPDVNYCVDGCEGWIEFKLTSGDWVKVRPEQVAWLEQRTRAGGRCFLMVRRKTQQLWIFAGSDARRVMDDGVQSVEPSLMCEGGPAKWPWANILELLKK